MKKWFVAGLVGAASIGAWAESVTNNLDVQGGFIYNHGIVNPGDLGLTFTNAGVRDITVSAGQLSGVNPETGEVITNSANLLPLKAQSLATAGDITAGGSFIGNGLGLTNLNVESFNGTIRAASLPASGIWDVSGLTIQNANLSGDVRVEGNSLTVSSNLIVQGIISGDGSGLRSLAAGGPSGSIQFNQSGQLAGCTNIFIHPETGRPCFRAVQGNLFRVYKDGIISDENMIFSLRDEDGSAVVHFRRNGQDTIRLSSDGSIYTTGALNVGGLSFGGGGASGSTGWFIPEEGDLSMGSFTQQ